MDNKNRTFNTQDIDILSQENPQFLSQEPQKCSQPTKTSMNSQNCYSQDQAISKIDLKKKQNTVERISKMKFVPQQQKGFLNDKTSTTVHTPHSTERRGNEMNSQGKNLFVNS